MLLHATIRYSVIVSLNQPVLRLSVAILIVVLLEGLLLIVMVPAGAYGPEQTFLTQLNTVRAGGAADGLYPYLAWSGLQASPLNSADYVYALRLMSMAFSGMALILLLVLIRFLFPNKPYLPPASLLVFALMPAFVLTMSQATPQALVTLLAVAALGAGLWMLRQGVSLLTLGIMLACFLLGMQLDWGFWWLAPAFLVSMFLAITLPGTQHDQWVAQVGVIVGIGIALFGVVTALRGEDQLVPLIDRMVRRLNDIVAAAAVPTPTTVWDLVRRFWAGATAPNLLWFGAVLLWSGLCLYGLERFVQNTSWRDLSAHRRAEWLLLVVFGGSLLAGAILVPGSVATWPAPLLGLAGPALALGWGHIVPADARPQWLLLGLFALALLNGAALLG